MTSNIAPVHLPVLRDEVLGLLDVRPSGQYIDGTTGLGGHSEAIAERLGPDGRLLCIDRDANALEFARQRLAPFGRRISFCQANYSEMADVAAREGFSAADGILLDLGVSSYQLDTAERGFSIQHEGPLDMRMDQDSDGPTAAEIANTWSETELADLIFQYGEDRMSRRIARAIVRARPLRTTADLARAAEQAMGGVRGRTQIHPATRAFLAFRIYVNGELDHLLAALPRAHGLLSSGNTHRGGRLAVISFHSLEDRIVKNYLRRESTGCLCPPGMPVCRCDHQATLKILTHKGVRAGEQELRANPRSRSAVLRAAERIAA